MEFVLVYPTFLALLCCSMWIAIFFLRKADVAIAARYDVDRQRASAEGTTGSEPFDFDGKTDGRVSASKTANVRFSDFMPAGKVSSRYSVTTGTWDFRQLPMDVAPDYELAAKLGGRGPIASVAGRLGGLLATVRDVGDLVGSMSSLFGLNDTASFFSGFGSAVREIGQSQLGDGGGLMDAGQTQGFNSAIGQGVGSLGTDTGTVNEIARIYRDLVGGSDEVRQVASRKIEGARQSAQKLETDTAQASAAFDDSSGAIDELDRALEASDATPDQKKAAIEAARSRLAAMYRQAEAGLARQDAKEQGGINGLVAASFRKTSEGRIPGDLEPLEGLAGAVKRGGLAGLSGTSDSLLDQLLTAVDETDAAKEKEAEQKLRRSLTFVTEATKATLDDTAAAAKEMRTKTDSAADRASQLGRDALPAID